jgi:hypothetical protein
MKKLNIALNTFTTGNISIGNITFFTKLAFDDIVHGDLDTLSEKILNVNIPINNTIEKSAGLLLNPGHFDLNIVPKTKVYTANNNIGVITDHSGPNIEPL